MIGYMRRRRPQPCPACPEGASSCACDSAEAKQDKAANAWARSQGERLESAHKKLGLCGDRFPTFEKRRALVERMLDAKVLRDYREMARIRREQIEQTRAFLDAEDAKLKLHVDILDLHFDEGALEGGLEPKVEIARRFGFKSHSWTSERMAEIRRAAIESAPAGNDYVGLPCKRPRCGKPIERVSANGQHPEYCRDACANAHHQAMWRARKRAGMVGEPEKAPPLVPLAVTKGLTRS